MNIARGTHRHWLVLALVPVLLLGLLGQVVAQDGGTDHGRPGPDLMMTDKHASKPRVVPGETIDYAIRLRNRGLDEIVVQVTDKLPAEVEYVTGSASPAADYDGATRTLSWKDVSVPAYGQTALTYQVTAGTVDQITLLINVATIEAEGGTFQRRALVYLMPELPGSGPNLTWSHKRASRHVVEPGEKVEYTIRLRNHGDSEARVQVTDFMPAEMAYKADSAKPPAVYDGDKGTLTWDGVAVPARGETILTFAATAGEVEKPTLTINKAAIWVEPAANAAAVSPLERRAPVLIMPQRPRPEPRLRAVKTVDPRRAGPEDTLTFTIRLHNSGTADAVAQVVDQLPAELDYVENSADPAAIHDAAQRTLTWTGVTVPPREDVSITFEATPAEVDVPTPVTNKATITAGELTLERMAQVVLLPEPPTEDKVPPTVKSLTIDDQDVLDTRDVTLHIEAQDDVEVRWMYLKEWQWTGEPRPRWEQVQSSGWIPFQAAYPWTLGEGQGAHYVAVWVGDGAYNRSHVRGRAADFASLVEAGATLPRLGMVPYLVYYDAGVEVTAALTQVQGEPELYVWQVRRLKEPIALGVQQTTFTTDSAGVYLFAVRGAPGDVYDLSIQPPGGPRVPALSAAEGPVVTAFAGPASPEGPSLATAVSWPEAQVADDLATMFMESGLDPLESADEPGGEYLIFMPLVSR